MYLRYFREFAVQFKRLFYVEFYEVFSYSYKKIDIK